ncbi:6-phosphogluconolactonase [Candidatus Saccharibacteria bacterium]|nr:6-phosphogluconolactonase [Candidatus Saccharibacteria bacterium]
MKFSTEGVEVAIAAIASAIAAPLQDGKKVLWLTSGGSCIRPQVAVMAKLRELPSEQLAGLRILPVDERYGPVGHENSNSEQMRQASFDPGTAQWFDVLEGKPMAATVEEYANTAADLMAESSTVVASLGMGPDAHTAGLLPHSPVFTDTTSSVVGYSWSDYERMTLGVEFLLQIDIVFLLAYGESKKAALERLHSNTEPIEDVPAKLLYDLPNVTVYNDFIRSERT